VSEVKRFLGLVHFSYCRRTTEEAYKERRAIRVWSRAGGLYRTETEVNAGYFDHSAKTKIIADASPVGLLAVFERTG